MGVVCWLLVWRVRRGEAGETEIGGKGADLDMFVCAVACAWWVVGGRRR